MGNANPSALTIPYIGTNYVGNLLSSPQATNMENQSSLRFFAANPKKQVVHQIGSFLPTWNSYYFFSVMAISDHFDTCVERDSLLTLTLGPWSRLCVIGLLFLLWRLVEFFFVFSCWGC